MENILEIIVKAKDAASGTLKNVQASVEEVGKEVRETAKINEEATKNFEAGWKAVTEPIKAAAIAMIAVGAAGLKMSSDARKMNADLGYTGQIIHATTGEMRELALSITDVSTPLSEVTPLLELLARSGVTNQETMKQNALAFDALGDATKQSADVVAEILIPAYKMFGERLPTTIDQMDKWTYLITTTNVELTELGSLMGYIATYGRDLNISGEQVVVMMKAMAEQGRSASDAARLLRTGIREADGSMEKLYRILGLTDDEIERYTEEVRDAQGITKELADQQETQYSIMDRLKQKWSELTLTLAPVLEFLEPIFAGMTALGTASLTLVLVLPKLITQFRLLKASMTAARIEALAMWGAVTLGVSLVIAGITGVISSTERAKQSTEEYNQSLKDLATTILADVGMAHRTTIADLQTETRLTVASIEERRKVWKEAHFERMSQLTEQFIAELRAIAPEAYAKIFQPLTEGGKSLYETWQETTQGIRDTEDALNDLRAAQITKELKILDPRKDKEEILRLQLELYQLTLPDLDQQFADIMKTADIKEEDINTYFDPLVTAANQAGLDAIAAFKASWEPEFANIMSMSALQLENFIKEKLPEIYAKYFPGAEVPEYQVPPPPEKRRSPWDRILDPLRRGEPSPITMYQHGGIAMKPTLGMIGEREPEAVIPLSQLGTPGNVTVNVGYLMGDETSLRRFARHLQQLLGEEARRNQFAQVQSGYFFGKSGL